MQAEPLDQVTEDRVETETETATSEVEETTAEVTEDTPEVFPGHDVEELRQENGKYRQRTQRPTRSPSACTSSWFGPPAAWPIQPISRSTNPTSATPTP